MRAFIRLTLVAVAMAVAVPDRVLAHGGVSVEDDICIMQVGRYRAHFTGYQPRERASQEFCEDIPELAPAIIVLDFVDMAMRKMAIDFRVLKDVKEIGVTATINDLGSTEDIESATVFYREPSISPHGSLDVSLNFKERGGYIGVLTATDLEGGHTYTSVFPFSVGVTDWWSYLRWIVWPLVFGVVIYFGSGVYRKISGKA
jgi:hypothetical protein